MRLSPRDRLAFEVLAELSRATVPLQCPHLLARLRTSKATLKRVLAPLCEQRLIGRRERQRGYVLMTPLTSVTVGDVLYALHGPINPGPFCGLEKRVVDCLDGLTVRGLVDEMLR